MNRSTTTARTAPTTALVTALVTALLMASSSTGCQTARGFAEAGELEKACLAVERAPSPFFDDDHEAMASRIRHRLTGQITVRPITHDALVKVAGAPVGEHPGLMEIIVEGDGVLDLRRVNLIDGAGTRLRPVPVTEALILRLVGAPPPPPRVVHHSTHTPGALESIIKGIAIATIGIPLAIGTLGIISPDLGGALDPSRSTTSTWTTDHPELAAWQAIDEVQAAVRIGEFVGVGQAPCAGGHCRQVVTVARSDVWQRAEVEMVLSAGDCAVSDSVTIAVGAGGVAFTDTAQDTGQWGRFWNEGLGLRPVVEDIGDAADDCVECGAACWGC